MTHHIYINSFPTRRSSDLMSQKQYDAIGELPRQHGLLGALLESPRSQRFPNIQEHPRFEGWPDPHPNMRSFLGVDRKSTRLNSSHTVISYAVFCLKKKYHQ